MIGLLLYAGKRSECSVTMVEEKSELSVTAMEERS